jgi:F-type H+-transporting ATPase subunit a
MSATIPVAADIKIGEHVTRSLFGLTLNVDTIWATCIAGAVVLGLGLFVRAKVSSEDPSKVQLAWEAIVSVVTRQVEDTLGRVNPFVVPLAIALFTFILIANWLELIPSGEDPKLLPAPTADVNLTYAMGLLVIVGVHIYSVRERGGKGYIKHYFEPYAIMFPLTFLEEIVKPFTLALRLFGNIFSGGIMIALIGLLPFFALWAPNIIWKLFDMFIGLIQAFIFALLTVLYFGMAGESHAPGHEGEHEARAHSDTDLATASQTTEQPEPVH